MIKRAVSALDHERNSAELPPDSTWLRYLPLLRQNHWRKMDGRYPTGKCPGCTRVEPICAYPFSTEVSYFRCVLGPVRGFSEPFTTHRSGPSASSG